MPVYKCTIIQEEKKVRDDSTIIMFEQKVGKKKKKKKSIPFVNFRKYARNTTSCTPFYPIIVHIQEEAHGIIVFTFT